MSKKKSRRRSYDDLTLEFIDVLRRIPKDKTKHIILATGMPHPSFYKWKNGRTVPELETVRRILPRIYEEMPSLRVKPQAKPEENPNPLPEPVPEQASLFQPGEIGWPSLISIAGPQYVVDTFKTRREENRAYIAKAVPMVKELVEALNEAEKQYQLDGMVIKYIRAKFKMETTEEDEKEETFEDGEPVLDWAGLHEFSQGGDNGHQNL